MEKAYFPMFVDISHKKIVVAGGGRIAARRVETLGLFASDITVVAPDICAKLRDMGEKICLVHRRFEARDIEDADIVLAAANDHELNESIVNLCRKKGILVNTADDKERCDFYFPGIVQKGEITIGLNSGGKNPEKVKNVRKRIEELPDI